VTLGVNSSYCSTQVDVAQRYLHRFDIRAVVHLRQGELSPHNVKIGLASPTDFLVIPDACVLLLYTTQCLKKTVQICFCQKFVECLSILIIFVRKMAEKLELCKVHSFSTSLNLCHHATVLKTHVPNCYTTLKVGICNKLSDDLISTQSKMWFITVSRIISLYNGLVHNCQNILCSKCPPCTRTQALRQRRHRKRESLSEAAFVASREYLTVQGLKWLKCTVVCYFQGRIIPQTF